MNDFLSRLFWGDQKDDQPKPQGKKKRINLALQGGGAHGAFTWGVLDHLLDDGRLAVEGISGTSAGAVNAVMLADGLNRGGPEEARKRLADFWRAASLGGDLPAVQRAITDKLFALWPGDGSPTFNWLSAWSQQLSPYDVNPLNINPLSKLIERFVDFEALHANTDLALYISATNVHTGRLRIFSGDKINAEVVMASAALPFIFRAVEIDGVPYWDGGYMGNPAIFPFLHATEAEDVLVVQINPVTRPTTPRSSAEIINRLNEKVRAKFIIFGLAAGALFTGVVAWMGGHFVWENGAHHGLFSLFGLPVQDLIEGPTTPDLEWPTWMVYSAIPLGTGLMCFRFLQVMVAFIRTGALPHHDHDHVDGLEEDPEEAAAQDINPYALRDNLHPDESDHQGRSKP